MNNLHPNAKKDIDDICVLFDVIFHDNQFCKPNGIPANLNWHEICSGMKLSEEFIDHFKDSVCWECVSAFQDLSEEAIEYHEDRIHFDILWNNDNIEMTGAFFEKYKDRLCPTRE